MRYNLVLEVEIEGIIGGIHLFSNYQNERLSINSTIYTLSVVNEEQEKMSRG